MMSKTVTTPLDYPENYLWIRFEDNRLTCLDLVQLCALRDGVVEPSNLIEARLIENPDDIDRIIACLGNVVITVSDDTTFPMKWNFDPREVY